MSELVARTGRVQNWIDNPESRLPVSCTVFVVEDSMEGPDGIEKSWRFVSHALRLGAGCAIHLSKLRPRGTDNGQGLTASGPVSFAKIYSTLNEILRRGGQRFKKGAVVAHLDIDHADVIEFVRAPRAELPWIKRCINLDEEKWRSATDETRDAIIHGIRSGDIWLNKIRFKDGKRIYGNVCLEVYLPSRGTCLLQHVALSACKIGQLRLAFSEGMSSLCELHSRTGVDNTGEYLSPKVDRQVGLGVLGLANFLRQNGITYKDFGDALETVNKGEWVQGKAGIAAKELYLAIHGAADIARLNKMDRAFAIAPTASCSYKTKGLDGFTSTPEIAPPIARTVDRDSDTEGIQTFEYGDVEIASEVGWDAYKKVADQLMYMLNKTGLLHGYSFNSWSDVVEYDNEFVEEWLRSPQTSLYYSLQVMPNTQDKTSVYTAIEESEVDDYLQDILKTKEPITCDCQE